jgi:NAD(P)-dependent dehydrogenase (short-subunit alcohol dehydrogenase family)
MRALVIGSSGGIGSAIVETLSSYHGTEVVGLSRRGDGLDITDEGSVEAHARILREGYGDFDTIINATGALVIDGAPPEKTIKTIDPETMAAQFQLNAIGPALVLKHFHTLLPRKRRSVFASLSARVGSIGDNRLGGWISYRAAKAAQNQIIKTASLEIARTHPNAVVVALHPGTVDTSLARPFATGHRVASPAEAAIQLLKVIEFLEPSQSGGFFSYDGSAIEW